MYKKTERAKIKNNPVKKEKQKCCECGCCAVSLFNTKYYCRDCYKEERRKFKYLKWSKENRLKRSLIS